MPHLAQRSTPLTVRRPQENSKYEELLEIKMGSDSYVDSAAQTLPSFPKAIEVQADPPATCEAVCRLIYSLAASTTGLTHARCMQGTLATNWDIYDAFHPNDSEAEPGEKATRPRPAPAPAPAPEPEEAPASAAEPEAGAEPEPEEEVEPEPEPLADVSHLESLPENLAKIERMLTQNLYHGQHLEYRNYRSAQVARVAPEPSMDEGASDEPALHRLWTFSCEQTEGRNVSAMSWNKDDTDLVAAAYGEFEFSVEQKDGAIALWSLKNPTHPERVYSLPCGVTAIDWSAYHPFLLAVGLYDGNVAIFDMRSEEDAPILASGNNTEKHHDPVWQVQWIDKGMERGECLVSISTDGRVKVSLPWLHTHKISSR